MSDRSYAAVTIYAVPDAAAAATVRDILRNEDLGVEFADTPGLEEEGVRLGLEYCDMEMTEGSMPGIAADLAATGATFEAVQEAAGDTDGVKYMHTPELGKFRTLLSGANERVVHVDDVAEAITGTQNREDLVRALEILTGAAWVKALEAAEDAIVPDPSVQEGYGAGTFGVAEPLCATCLATQAKACPC